MKNLIIFIGLSFIFCVQAFAQDNLPCPKISVSGPDNLVKPDEIISFTAKVNSLENDDFVYEWTISEGEIIEGQGKSIIKVGTLGLYHSSITASVKLKDCGNSDSATANIIPICFLPVPIKLDEFSTKSSQIRKDKFINLVLLLNGDSTAQGYILRKFNSSESRKKGEREFGNILDFLRDRKISFERVSLFIADGDTNLTEIWIVQQGAIKPPIEDFVQINAQTYKQDLAKVFGLKQKTTLQTKKKN